MSRTRKREDSWAIPDPQREDSWVILLLREAWQVQRPKKLGLISAKVTRVVHNLRNPPCLQAGILVPGPIPPS